MAKLKSSRRNLPRLTAVIGFLLLVIGFSLWGISSYMIQQREQLLNNANMPIEEIWQHQTSLSWWNDAYDTMFLPFSILFVVLSVIILVSRQWWLKIAKENTLKSSFTAGSDLTLNQSGTDATTTITQSVLNLIREKKPDTVEQLVNLVEQKTNLSKNIIITQVLSMRDNGKIKFTLDSSVSKRDRHLFSLRSIWYWALLLLTAVTVILIFYLPEELYSDFYVRQFVGALFVLFAPGYALIKTLYPDKTLDNITKIGLSIATSMGLVCLTAFLLNFTPWKITLLSLVVSLSIIIILFATVGVVRERNALIVNDIP